ncbi:thymidine phosphorylase [Rhodopirellula sp. MGV]|uniref:thymidine phosphorylase n=1 Tax=Rhodopirellula sp. MGV TaxID=2023130 RepID=UPI000B962B51|nr:thymidine phosphorylase [Rhodopirellula sp. MGV]OYP28349.1 thymidine phosphorylase [Rhodopirellula sp. MGV]PNY38775.1 thymidine phosphorylase [Rhodopirellula baltica]
MLAANLLVKKREGVELTDDEIRFLIDGFCRGSVADYQMSALAMAVCLRGMSAGETESLTRAMLESGDLMRRECSADTPRVDKHSTGGLGDKVSIVLAPLLAACGVHVPMISGRGLGLTGGTLDKLESISGFRTDLDQTESETALQQVGAFIVSASEKIAPADRRLYALRDVTGTVESIPLITASILSKKLAANLDALVMDVKVGSAAFMTEMEQARALADSICRVGKACGLPTSVLISDMDQPLGAAVGNAIEINESVAILKGELRDDPLVERARELTLLLCAELLTATNVAGDSAAARVLLERALADGSAMEKFLAMVHQQSGRWDGPLDLAERMTIEAQQDGWVEQIQSREIGSVIVELGGGRRRVGDPIDHSVGVSMNVQVGDRVSRGQPLMDLYCSNEQQNDYAERLRATLRLADEPVELRPLTM